MGRELAIACIPLAKMTTDRTQELRQLVDNLDVNELTFDDCPDDFNEAELRSTLYEYIELIIVAEDHWRDVNHIWNPDFPYTLLATGGDSWHGESPSDLYEAFCAIGNCEPILNQLKEWARKDKLQSI